MTYIYFFILVSFIWSPLQAQEIYSRNIMPALELGMNISNQQIRRNPDKLFSHQNGLRAGIVLEKPQSKRLTFSGSLSYVQSGSNNVLFTGGSEILHYAEFAIRVKEYLPLGGSEIFLSLGPYLGYGFAGERTRANGETISNNVFKEQGYRPFEWGIGGYAGFKFPWGSYLQAGLQTALSNCFVSEQVSYFNYSLMLTAGHSLQWQSFRSYRK